MTTTYTDIDTSWVLNCREIVKRIDMWGIDMVFVVGGNGGNAGAAAIQAQCEKDQVVCNIVGVPKSIDNDILVVRSCVVRASFTILLLQMALRVTNSGNLLW